MKRQWICGVNIALVLIGSFRGSPAQAGFSQELLDPSTATFELRDAGESIEDRGTGDENSKSAIFQRNELMDRSIGIYVNKSGQDYFRNHLDKVLFAYGTRVDRKTIKHFDYTAAEPIHLASLGPSYLAFRDLMTKWFSHFQLNDPKLSLSLDKLKLSADIDQFGVRFDAAGLRAFGLSHGAVVYLEAKVPGLHVNADSLLIQDTANPDFGKMGGQAISLDSSPGSVPFQMQIPLHIDLDESGHLKINVLKFSSNLPDTDLNLGFKKLVLPKMSITIGSRTMDFDQDAFEKDILSRQRDLMKSLSRYLSQKAKEELPSLLSKIIGDQLRDGITDLNEMDPPGATAVKPGEKFRLGIAPRSIQVSDRFFYLGLAGFIEDPLLAKQPSLQVEQKAQGLPTLNGRKDNEFKMAVALNQGFINRALFLSWQRHYFDRMLTSSGKQIDLVEAPMLSLDKNLPANEVKLKLLIQYQPPWYKKWIFSGSRVVFSVDLIGKVTKQNGSLAVMIDRLENAIVKQDNINYFKGQVLDAVRDSIAEANAEYQAKPEALVPPTALPPEILGIPIQVVDLQSEPTGHVVLYLNYGDEHAN